MEQRDTSNGTSNSYPPPASAPWPQPQHPAQPIAGRRRRHPVLSHAVVAVVALGLGAGIGSAGHGSGASSTQAGATTTLTQGAAPATDATSSAAPAPTSATRTTAAAAAPATSTSSVPTTVSGDGEYQVGVDMQAGTYRTAGPEDGSFGGCYWERDKNASGDFDAIIANDNLSGSGIVTVKRGEYFKSSGCQSWVRVG